MANRTGTYFAFDGLGQADRSKSDLKYYTVVQGWNAAKGIDFKFVNSHEKASAVRDTSKLETLKVSIRQRLVVSKNMVVIISADTRKSGSLLSWEIERAVDVYKLPLIVAYAGFNSILEPRALSSRWPSTLATRINNRTAKAIHIPFKKDIMLASIRRFTVNGEEIGGSLVTFTKQAHINWGYIAV
ncbi:TIR domain-containing protein [Lentibacter sp. XHP0401]|uniref:TIR domain-containing protein n=1 Tax=Lentibacter sp. XHP0401 TaxID=2984334 RepID=UPI0021E94BDA|nr:TIR domain-containing protein [Lentibacter sp. XHP0401]MCV2894401.1 TIR domain-containing protein [Lentibacter sp. XHP0401]